MDLIIARTLALLLVATLVAIVARRVRLPYTVGLILAGAALTFGRIDTGVTLTHDIIFDVILPPLAGYRQIDRRVYASSAITFVEVVQ